MSITAAARAIGIDAPPAAGDGDSLSGRHPSVHDDLDAVLAHPGEVRNRDLHVLRPERLRNLLPDPPPDLPRHLTPKENHPMSTTYRPAAAPAYYLGRPAGAWRTALRWRNRTSPLELIDATTIDRGRKADDRPGAMQ